METLGSSTLWDVIILELKKPFSFDEQVQRLISHGMEVNDIDLARRVLSEINYYRFTGYALQFRDVNNPDDYIPGTTFENVLRIHKFDTDLRCILKACLDTVELHARSQISYGFSMSKCQMHPHNQHYDPANFYNKGSHKSIFDLSVAREKEHNKDSLFVIHHAQKYEGKMPLWVIVELLSFTNLSKLYSAMYSDEQHKIAENMGTTNQTLKNHLHCMANLRNKIAHAGRLYNVVYNPPAILGRKYLQKNPNIHTNTLFAYLIILMRRIPNNTDKLAFVKAIENIILQYFTCIQLSLLGFPSDYMRRFEDEVK